MVVFACTRWPGLLPSNFSAAYALVFCAGVYFPGRMAWFLPILTMFITDVLMNLFYYHLPPLSRYMMVNYGVYLLLIALGRRFSQRSPYIKLVSGGLAAALIFYFMTNTAAWLQNPEYPKSLAGWWQALTVGTPGWPQTWTFFRNTVLSGGLFTALFAGAMKLDEALEKQTAEDREAGTEDAKAEEEGSSSGISQPRNSQT